MPCRAIERGCLASMLCALASFAGSHPSQQILRHDAEMSPIRAQLGPPWSPSLDAYKYLSGLTKPDWAWECVRRNLNYQVQVQSASLEGVVSQPLETGALLTRLTARAIGAEAWGLSF